MKKENMTVGEKFLSELSKHMNNSDELSLKTIYSLFPEMNMKTILLIEIKPNGQS